MIVSSKRLPLRRFRHFSAHPKAARASPRPTHFASRASQYNGQPAASRNYDTIVAVATLRTTTLRTFLLDPTGTQPVPVGFAVNRNGAKVEDKPNSLLSWDTYKKLTAGST